MSSNTKVLAASCNLVGSCGIGLLYSFRQMPKGLTYSDYGPEVTKLTPGGTGFMVAAFVNSKPCKQAFEDLVKAHKVVFQSPMRRNNNSGRGFFFLVLDRATRKSLGYTPIEAKWPWKKEPTSNH